LPEKGRGRQGREKVSREGKSLAKNRREEVSIEGMRSLGSKCKRLAKKERGEVSSMGRGWQEGEVGSAGNRSAG